MVPEEALKWSLASQSRRMKKEKYRARQGTGLRDDDKHFLRANRKETPAQMTFRVRKEKLRAQWPKQPSEGQKQCIEAFEKKERAKQVMRVKKEKACAKQGMKMQFKKGHAKKDSGIGLVDDEGITGMMETLNFNSFEDGKMYDVDMEGGNMDEGVFDMA